MHTYASMYLCMYVGENYSTKGMFVVRSACVQSDGGNWLGVVLTAPTIPHTVILHSWSGSPGNTVDSVSFAVTEK